MDATRTTSEKKLTTKQTATEWHLPNTARMYDYYLGGTHNTEADRKAAGEVDSYAPFVGYVARLQRACLKDIPAELARRGFDLIIDFASGLPTQDHLHENAPEGVAVVYADLDPVIVEYSREILGNTPNVHYLYTDMRNPLTLLNESVVQQLLNEGRKPALVIWGICLFLSDEDIDTITNVLYDWAPNGTCLAFNVPLVDMNRNNEAVIKFLKTYEDLNEPIYVRSLEKVREIIHPWKPDERGFVSFLDWHGLGPSSMTPDDLDAVGPTGGGYAAYLVK
ncbi:MAG: hypothetical protein HC884_17430 [Chloroflexaceae bacterium]|nr:hypothetical protein [Chloroflexaceae bacterium]